jgi:hypothetical protein
MNPAVTEVILVERFARTQCEQLIQGAILLRPVARFLALLHWKPLWDFRGIRRRPAAAARTGRWLQTCAGAASSQPMLPAGPGVPDLMSGSRGVRIVAKFGSLSTSATRTFRTESCRIPVRTSNLSMPPFLSSPAPLLPRGPDPPPARPKADDTSIHHTRRGGRPCITDL